MPYVDLLSKEDYTSLFYSTNTPFGNVGSFDPEKPTIAMIHPQHMDSSWLYPQLDDPRLRSRYNIIVFDTRVTGKSVYRFNGKYDLWVTAADLAHAFHYLGLPAAHFFASEVFCHAICRFAAIFPEFCLSITLCNVPAQSEMKQVFDAYDELCSLWGYAEDLETFEHANKLLLSYCASPTSHVDTQDDIIASWQVEYPPWKRGHLIAFAQVCLNRTAMTPAELAAIKVPTLIIQADRNPLYPMQNAENLQNALVNVPGGAMIFTVKAEIGFITIFSASIVNQAFSKFLARQPRSYSHVRRKIDPCDEVMQTALARLAALKVDKSIMSRDPKSPLSFSCVTEEVRKAQEGAVTVYSKGQRKAWSPLGMDGRPLRKFSERGDHWLQSDGADGYSYSVVDKKQPAKEEKKRSKLGLKSTKQQVAPPPPATSPPRVAVPLPVVELLDTEPVSSVEQQIARSRRMMIDPSDHSVEQQVIKGSMTKVMTQHATAPLARMLR
ncbi:hypothetical protein EIP91_005609 [Steccherinum ochraceum]|uniref:AB hydrolase-1 domain-containing protein n=1 Tax=Steccherinum ochraceum TaxID=92696 RepID=A0A4R0RHZ4_9APHY|nr:hypothetical protein EIP91_005609 [Steccherinum ochraceum]